MGAMDSLVLAAGAAPLAEPIEHLRQWCAGVDAWLSGMERGIDDLYRELEREADTLFQDEQHLLERRRALDLQLAETRRGDDDAAAMRQQRDELSQQCAALEAHLETVRSRAAELAERLEDQTRRFEQERGVWQRELGKLRRVLARASGERAAPAVQKTSLAEPEPPGANVAVGGAKEDQVLSTVLAQFDAVRRTAGRQVERGARE
jgi:flagellar motility protein MotE (MotC chaperone)